MIDQATFEQELKRLGFGVHHPDVPDPESVPERNEWPEEPRDAWPLAERFVALR